jgi:hypothetical protein
MKKSVYLFIAIVLIALLSFPTYAVDTKAKRVNIMSPAANYVKLGNMLDRLNAVMRGEEVMATQVTLAAGTSDTAKVLIGAHVIWVDGLYYSIPAAELAFTATTHDCANGKWRTYRVSMEADSTGVITHAASTYTTRALAIAALPACPAGDVDLGYIVVYADGALFDATTTKLNASTVDIEYVPATCYTVDMDAN